MDSNNLFDYLVRISLQKYYQVLIEHGIDLEAMSLCEDEDFKEIGIESKEDRKLLVERFKDTRRRLLSKNSTSKSLQTPSEPDTVLSILKDVGLDSIYPIFQDRGIQLKSFLKLKEMDLIDLGINLKGHRVKIIRAIKYRYRSLENPMSTVRRNQVTSVNPLAASPRGTLTRIDVSENSNRASTSSSVSMEYSSSPTTVPFLQPQLQQPSVSSLPKPKSYEPISLLLNEHLAPFIRISTRPDENEGLMSYEGYMYKKTVNKNSARKTLNGWKKYYFVLDGRIINVFKSHPYLEDRDKPRTRFSIQGARVELEEDKTRRTVIRISLADGPVYLLSPKDEEFESWLDCLNMSV